MFVTSVFDTIEALFGTARNLFQSTAQINTMMLSAILLPGGNTPRPLFQRIEENPFPVAPNFHIAYTDERLVPEQDPANNYAVSTAMLRALNIPDAQILRVDTKLSLEAAASDYNNAWKNFFERCGELPLAFLGLGSDGHTCSLFTAEQIASYSDNCFAAAVLREEGTDRVTVTPALLSRIRHIVILVTGHSKAAIVNVMTNAPENVAAGMALAGCSRVSIWYSAQE